VSTLLVFLLSLGDVLIFLLFVDFSVWGTMNRTSVWETRMQMIGWMREEVVKTGRLEEYGEGRG
jgi:hypothetical protein